MFNILSVIFPNISIYWQIFFLIIVSIFIVLAFAYGKVRHKWQCIARIPGPTPVHPLYGSLEFPIKNSLSGSNNWTYNSLQWLDQLAHQFGKDGVMRIWVGPLIPIVVLTRPDTIEKVLSSPLMIDKAKYLYEMFKTFLGNGLGTSKISRWKYNRKLLNPAFSYRVLQNFLPIITEQQNILMEIIDKQVRENSGIVHDIRPVMSMFFLDTICETAMGVRLESQTKGEPEYLKILHKMCDIAVYKMVRPWLWLTNISKYTESGKLMAGYIRDLHSFTDGIIRERKMEIRDKNCEQTSEECGRRSIFLDLLLEHHLQYPQNLTEYHVRSEVDTFTFAGHHTCSSSVVWTLLLVGHHPSVQQKIHRELDAVLVNNGEDITMDELRSMKYLECVVKESLRLYPVAPLIGRQSGADFQIGKYLIPKDTFILIFISHVQRLEEYYVEPDRFIPERFMREENNNNEYESASKSAYAFIPFSAGARNCIGQRYGLMQQKAVLAKMLAKYRITSMNKMEDIEVGVDFVLGAKSPISIKFELR